MYKDFANKNKEAIDKACIKYGTGEIPYTKAPPLCQWTNTLAYYTWVRLALNRLLSDGNFRSCGIHSITVSAHCGALNTLAWRSVPTSSFPFTNSLSRISISPSGFLMM